MRTGLAIAALGLGLGLAGQAHAQTSGSFQPATSFFTGVNPRNINLTPIDTSSFYKKYSSQIIRPPTQQSAFNLSNIFHPTNSQIIRPPTQQSAFSLSNIFHGFTMPSWPPRIGSSTVPTTTTHSSLPNLLPGNVIAQQ